MVRQNEVAKDVFQDVWIQVIQKLDTFAFKGSFKSWLYTIAHHKVIDHIRRIERRAERSMDEAVNDFNESSLQALLTDQTPGIVEQLSMRETQELIRKLVKELPGHHREVFLMRCDGNLKFREIAEILGVSLNCVLGRMHSAVKHIRKELKKELDI
jgi:RNA polymerase sigma-70 factor (ECF subfamily)